MGRWDRDFKVVGRLRPLDLLGVVPGFEVTGAESRSLDKELASAPPMPRAFDLFLEVEDGRGHKQAFQIEAEARPRSDTGKRVFGRWSYAHLVLRRPLECVVFYLLPARDGRRPQERYTIRRGATSVDFRFEAVCLWRLLAEELLEKETPGLWALIALTAGCRREHVAQACNLLEKLGDAHLVSELLGVWFEVAGVRFRPADLEAMVSRKELLMESSTYRAVREEGVKEGLEKGLQEGLEKGLQKGLQEGRQEALSTMSKLCRGLVEAKLGRLPPEASVIDRIVELEKLSRLADMLMHAADRESVREALRSIDEQNPE